MKWDYISRGDLAGQVANVAMETIGKIIACATDAGSIQLIDGVRLATAALLDHIGNDEKEGEADDAGGKD